MIHQAREPDPGRKRGRNNTVWPGHGRAQARPGSDAVRQGFGHYCTQGAPGRGGRPSEQPVCRNHNSAKVFARRQVTGAAPLENATSENAVMLPKLAIGRFDRPSPILSDNGSRFVGRNGSEGEADGNVAADVPRGRVALEWQGPDKPPGPATPGQTAGLSDSTTASRKRSGTGSPDGTPTITMSAGCTSPLTLTTTRSFSSPRMTFGNKKAAEAIRKRDSR